MAQYYVLKIDGKVCRLMKFDDSGAPLGYENGKWELMPGLMKIKFEDTDYELISKEEAMQIKKEIDEKSNK